MRLNNVAKVTPQQQAEIELRRSKVAANLLAGLNYRDMAEALGVSVGTICSDAKAVLRRWHAEQAQAVEERRMVEERRLDRALNAIWNAVLAGNLDAVDVFRKLSERRSRLLGLDAPAQSKVTIFDAVDQLLGQLPPDLRDEIIALLGGDALPGGAE